MAFFKLSLKRASSEHIMCIVPNKYEAGRANITIFNWGLKNTVNVDLSSVLKNGDSFGIKNVQNYFGNPVVRGVYSGGTVNIPMTDKTVAKPVGIDFTPDSTLPEFGVFVVSLSNNTEVTVTPTPSAITPTPTGTSSCPLKEKGDTPPCDSIINLSDFNIWRQEFGGTLTSKTADFGGPAGGPDGKVDLFDFNIWRSNYAQ